MMSNPINHHYVAQHVLRRFCDADGMLWVYDKQKNQIYPGPPPSQACGRHFYSFKAKDGTRTTVIELKFLGPIDGEGHVAIERLLHREILTAEQMISFARFAAAQMIRVESHFQRLDALLEAMLEESAKRMFKHHKEFKDRVTRRLREKFGDEKIEEFTAMLERGEVTVKPNRGFIISTFLNQLDSTTKDFCRMQWLILRTDATDEGFLLSDNPLVLDDIGEGPPQPLGTRNPNIEATMPLNPTTVALARWEEGGGVGYSTIKTEYISTINQRTIDQAHRFVYAPYRSEELLARVVESQGRQAKTRMIKFKDGEATIMMPVYAK